MTQFKQYCLGVAVVLAVAVCGMILGLTERKPLSSELQDLKAKLEQVKLEMTQEEVDALFGMVGEKVQVETDRNTDLKPLSRPCSFIKVYNKPESGIEGGYFVWVYFDYVGCVVGKSFFKLKDRALIAGTALETQTTGCGVPSILVRSRT